jgi:hypothetical protein
MGKINNYTEFILESKLDLILEAKIAYSDEFKSILSKIDLPISNNLIELEDKELDVNTNYIDINKEKDDIVYFKPDDKVTKLYKVIYSRHASVGSYYNTSRDLKNSGKYDIKNVKIPAIGQTGEAHKLTIDEIMKLYPDNQYLKSLYSNGVSIVHFKWNDGEILVRSDLLEIYIDESVSNSEIKIGRLVQSLLKKSGTEFLPKELEEFVDKYKAEIQIMRDVFKRFDIVKGEEIRKWYLENNYEIMNAGTLGKSCMADNMCQPYFNIYTENPKNVSLIILRGSKDVDKISGRAILWTDNDGNKIMDRVYTNNSPDVVLFIEYANKNNFYHKTVQDSVESTEFELNGSKLTDITINLDKNTYYTFPYMDTLKYYYYDKNILTNIMRDYTLNQITGTSDSNYYYLTGTRGNSPGTCEFCGGSGRVECPECDGSDPSCYYCYGDTDVDCPECQ